MLHTQRKVLSLSSPSPESIATEQVQSQKLHELLNVEESYLKQKSRVKWLEVGDQNSNYFHRVVKGKMLRSRITRLARVGTLASDESAIKEEILGFYKGRLGSPCSEKINCTIDELKALTSVTLSEL